jgi:TRAP-type uncharacterized transport system fused permease subunit
MVMEDTLVAGQGRDQVPTSPAEEPGAARPVVDGPVTGGPVMRAPTAEAPAADAGTDRDDAGAPQALALGDVPAEAEAERPARVLTGPLKRVIATIAVLLSLYALWNVFSPVPALKYRIIFLAVVLPLTFLLYRPAVRVLRGRPERRDRPSPVDWLLAAASLFVVSWPLITGFDDYISRSYQPWIIDVVCGLALTALVLLATWRTVGPILPVICGVFIAYAYWGNLIPNGWLIGHRGYDSPRLVSQFAMGTEGIYGVPLDVAATYIILFTIYGAVLEYSGAGQFFLDISFAAFRKSKAAP